MLFFHAFANLDIMKASVVRYLTQLAGIKPSLTGLDLLSMGIPQGPVFKEIISVLRRSRLDGEVRTRKDEIALVKKNFI